MLIESSQISLLESCHGSVGRQYSVRTFSKYVGLYDDSVLVSVMTSGYQDFHVLVSCTLEAVRDSGVSVRRKKRNRG